MGAEDRTTGTSGTGRARTGGDPIRMTEAEKRIAEWEARHDVAARGHRATPDALQHYLAHERLAHERLAHEQHGGARRPSPARAEGPAPTSDTPAAVPAPAEPHPSETRPRSLLRRLFRNPG